MKYKQALRLVLAIAILTSVAVSAHAENIDPDNDNSQYAWGENVGWIKMGADAGGPARQFCRRSRRLKAGTSCRSIRRGRCGPLVTLS